MEFVFFFEEKDRCLNHTAQLRINDSVLVLQGILLLVLASKLCFIAV